ncbi:hypothetical protein N665_0292s0046 [Sinapis alba]|nr:hypothetical protein N665_0292s0046 [Sinapis alba]
MTRLNASLISILLIISSLYFPSYSLLLDDLSVGHVAIFSIVRCSLDGDPNAPPISNGTVILTCGGLTDNLYETVTNPGGYFLIFLNFLQTLLFTPSVCDIRLTLPTGNCTISSPNGTLSFGLTLVSVAVTNTTNIAYYAVSALTSSL